jgi:hypothetical protein
MELPSIYEDGLFVNTEKETRFLLPTPRDFNINDESITKELCISEYISIQPQSWILDGLCLFKSCVKGYACGSNSG